MFLGHIYQSPDKIDPRLESTDYTRFGQVWLGGDICSETTEEESTLDYLENIFSLSAPTTHWAVGNHDVRNGNLQWIEQATQKPLFYSAHHDGLTLLVLNTSLQTEDCDARARQYDLFTQLTDTISQSSHLVLMSHYIIWGDVVDGVEMRDQANANKPFWEATCTPATQFPRSMYDQLKTVQARGVQVICLAGDFGQRVQSFSWQNPEGMWFLGAGFKKGNGIVADPEDQILIFSHDVESRQLDWRFTNVEEFLRY